MLISLLEFFLYNVFLSETRTEFYYIIVHVIDIYLKMSMYYS